MTRSQVDLNQLRETVIRNQRRDDAMPASADRKVFVDPEGKVVLGDSVRPEERRDLSEVQQGTFAGAEPMHSDDVIDVPFRVARPSDAVLDLNRLRATVLDNQRRGDVLPARPALRLVVGPDAQIRHGDQIEEAEERTISEIQQGVFAAFSSRAERERQLVAKKFPPNTRVLQVDGVSGWLYSFRDEFGSPYTIFAYHDGSLYQAKVVSPEVEGRYSPHNGHLYSDGTICFGDQMGLPALDQVFAKSVLWANGFSAFLRTGTFPFSKTNLR